MYKKRLVLIMVLMVLLTSFAMADSSWTCSKCQEKVSALLGDYCPYCGEHNHEWAPATCTEPELCSCGKTRGAALGHDWQEATCTEPRTCKGCGMTEGEALGHDWLEATCTEPKICRVCGVSNGKALGHDWQAPTCTEPQICKTCGAQEGQPFGHVWQEATCTEPRICKVCGLYEGQPVGHNWQEATCTEPRRCKECGKYEGQPLGHDWQAATCTEPKICKACGAAEGVALGHDWQEATCTEPITCKVCGTTEGVALGHDWQEATCTEPGTCKVCGTIEGAALGHDWQAATYQEPETCRRCGETRGEALKEPALSENPADGVMTHAQYVAAAIDDEVIIETYVQATQSWWDGKITVYGQSEDGAYFIYNMACSEEDAAKLVPGTKIRVKGYKAEWAGEVEIADGASFEILDGSFIAEAEDVTDRLGTDELINHMNEKVAFRGMTVEAYDESGAAFAYKNAENKTDDLYFKVSRDGQVYDFCVEFYLCGNETEVYKAVEALQVGDVIDIEAYLYWYNGANPHTVKVTKAESNSDGVMTHAQYVAAALDDEVTIETYVQATQSWWDGKITVYGQSEDGAYFIYNMTCSEEDAAKLVPGTKIRVKGYKAEWAGEVEIADGATFEILDGSFIAEAEDVTDKLGMYELINHMNEKVAFKGMTVEAYDESGAAFAYKNAENKTDDLYFKVSRDGQVYDFCVEFYLCGNDTEVYKAVEALQVGDVIDIEAYLYWYNEPNPHTVKVTRAE